MKLVVCFVFVTATMVVHGYKNPNHRNNVDCKSQLISLPGGNYEQQGSSSVGNYGKDSYPNYPENTQSQESYGPTQNNEYGSSGSYGNGEPDYLEEQQETPKRNSWDKTFANEVLTKHNFYRVQHTTPTVSLDDKMSRIAQDWATQLASGANQGHSPEAVEGEYGESIQVVSVPPTGNQVVSKWYQEKANYDFRQPNLVKSPPSRANRHFTAMIWYGTRKIGVGKAASRDGRTYVVVNYWPAGNIFDVLENNVLPSRSNH